MRRYLSILLGLSAMVLLSACGGTNFRGTKAGAGQVEFSNDFMECKAISVRLYGYDDANSITTCMQGKGWAITTTPKLF